MKKIILIVLAMVCAMPSFAQKLSKEEKAALAKAQNEAAVAAINSKAWVIVPSQYQKSDGTLESNVDPAIFVACENDKMTVQGYIVGGSNNQGYLVEFKEYEPTIDKKGNLKMRLVVNGRMMRGIYQITLRNNTNVADVIFTPAGKSPLKFQGPIVPLAGANYYKRSNPM
ncbi:MAG: hypothetical protein IKW15_05325 [Bacteroidales bacterium]|nr:hypothetical protein [Bacteroidales bacterium]